MAAEARTAATRNAPPVLLLQFDRVVGMASSAADQAWRARGGVAAIAWCPAMRPPRNGKVPVVVGWDDHAAQPCAEGPARRAREGAGIDERRAPGTRKVTLRAILREWRRRGRAAVVGMNTRIEVVGGMAGETIARNRRPLPFSVALMTLGAVRERMHAGQGEAGSAMNFERLRVVPPPGRMATVAPAAQPRLVRVAVTVFALSGHAPLAAVTLVAGRGFVSPGEREAGA